MDFWKRRHYENLTVEKTWRFGITKRTLVIISGITILSVVTLTVVSVPQLLGSSAPKNDNGGVLNAAPNLVAENTSFVPKTQVRIRNGLLEGLILKSRRGRDYASFYNIPYAEPSVGQFRFEPPREFTGSWKGVRDATKKSPKCAQLKFSSSSRGNNGAEDCHYLTIYTPVTSASATERDQNQASKQDLLPVMVYILGGAFLGGQASIYGGEYFMDKDVVLVLPECRQGVLGFLSTADAVVPGNMGFKDQVMVLKWVQKNIEAFGGDPKRVTIFGNSSGAVSIHCLMMSAMSAGLFHRAIGQSGSAITSPTGSLATDPKGIAEALGRKVGCPEVNSRELVDCLKKVDVEVLLEAQDQDIHPLVVENIPRTEGGDFISEEVFMDDTPLNIMKSGRGHPNVPWILGVNSNEMSIMAAVLKSPQEIMSLNSNWTGIGPTLLDFEDHQALTKVREFYFDQSNITVETRGNYTNMVNDRLSNHPTYITATLQAQSVNKSEVYLYWLTKRPIKSLGSFLENMFDPPYGVTHADEVQYLFPYAKFPYIGLDSVDLKMSETMVDLWVEFARTGEAPHEAWKPIPKTMDKGPIPWFQLDDELKMVDALENRMDFWNTFPLEYLYVQNVSYGSKV